MKRMGRKLYERIAGKHVNDVEPMRVLCTTELRTACVHCWLMETNQRGPTAFPVKGQASRSTKAKDGAPAKGNGGRVHN